MYRSAGRRIYVELNIYEGGVGAARLASRISVSYSAARTSGAWPNRPTLSELADVPWLVRVQ